MRPSETRKSGGRDWWKKRTWSLEDKTSAAVSITGARIETVWNLETVRQGPGDYYGDGEDVYRE
jgi:hypothetical protein